jgi:PAS domain S-box-containing protein
MQPDTQSDEAVFAAAAQLILDAHSAAAAMLDQGGLIVAANNPWLESASQPVVGSNYLDHCAPPNAFHCACPRTDVEAVRAVLGGLRDELHVEARKDVPHRLWISRLVHAGRVYALVRHLESAPEPVPFRETPERHSDQLERLAAASLEIAAAGSPKATLQAIADQARKVIRAHLGATHSIASNRWPEAAVAVSLSDKYARYRSFSVPPNGSGIYSEAIRIGRPIRLDRKQLPEHPAWGNMGAHKSEHPPLPNLLAAPVCAHDGGSFGVIMLSDKLSGEFTAEDEAMLIQLAQIASVCIRNALDARAHQDAEERLKATQEHANIAIGECDAEGRYVRVNSGFTSLTGFSQEEMLGRSFFNLTHPDDRTEERERHRDQLAGRMKAYTLEKRFLHKDGSARWALLSASAVFDSDGRFLYAIRVLQDIDQRKRAEEHQAAQVRELHHRVRNTLATVQGIMGATARSTDDIGAFKNVFSSRLASIARAHTLLTTDDWQTAPLHGLVQAEIESLEPHLGKRIIVEGASVELPATLAIVLSMAFHELADNARKHGALSGSEGQVAVCWHLQRRGDQELLILEWREHGYRPVREPVRIGYGTTLLMKVLPAQAKAVSTLHYEPPGICFRLEAPLGGPKRRTIQ